MTFYRPYVLGNDHIALRGFAVTLLLIVVGVLTFNAGFVAGAFWFSTKEADAKEHARQDAAHWLQSRAQ
jgi:flagellar basal body-associated protein FliL